MSVNDVPVTSIPHLTLSDPALGLEVAALRLAIISVQFMNAYDSDSICTVCRIQPVLTETE